MRRKWSISSEAGEEEACRRGEEGEGEGRKGKLFTSIEVEWAPTQWGKEREKEKEGDPLSRERKGERGERRAKLVKILRMREGERESFSQKLFSDNL